MTSLLTAMTLGTCGPIPEGEANHLSLRGHDYAQIGWCAGRPVFRTTRTDSTSLDRAAAPHPQLILVTLESVDPSSAEGGWPGPEGNLYLSTPFPGPPAQAKRAASAAVQAWAAPLGLPLSEGWDGPYGAHRASDGRFLTGLVVEPLGGAAWIGLDLHLNATSAQYAALGQEAGHVSVATLTGAPQDVDAALWSTLRRLWAQLQ
ncbi:MAG: hypothetical protein H6740_17775 [Alphaproteobacteria bacterium]|nr:hypothetical protein [Alphaproteobacteria bacterium]